MSTDYNLNRVQREQIRAHADQAAQLPAHPETWACYDVDLSQQALSTFSRHGIIESVATIPRSEHPSGTTTTNRWQTQPDVAAYVKEYQNSHTRTPCGCSTGFRTLTARQEFTCRNVECNRTFGREVALAVVDNEPLPTDEEAIEA
jgi:hypothetical protein